MSDRRPTLLRSHMGDAWTVRYEDLRQQALNSSPDKRATWGLTLFLRSGLVAWMRAWPQSPEPQPVEPMPEQQAERMCFPASLHDQVVSVLVNMFLYKHVEVSA